MGKMWRLVGMGIGQDVALVGIGRRRRQVWTKAVVMPVLAENVVGFGMAGVWFHNKLGVLGGVKTAQSTMKIQGWQKVLTC